MQKSRLFLLCGLKLRFIKATAGSKKFTRKKIAYGFLVVTVVQISRYSFRLYHTEKAEM